MLIPVTRKMALEYAENYSNHIHKLTYLPQSDDDVTIAYIDFDDTNTCHSLYVQTDNEVLFVDHTPAGWVAKFGIISIGNRKVRVYLFHDGRWCKISSDSCVSNELPRY